MAQKVSILSFIQLFIIRRILHTKYTNDKRHHSKSIEDKYNHKHNMIRKLASELEKTDQDESRAIISALLNNGIKKYMMSTFDATKQQMIIDKIFNCIVLTKFRKEDQQLYTSNSASQSKYQSLVFNAADMTCSIFQFLSFSFPRLYHQAKDFHTCSLVCSQWLYHVWNPNCIYHCDITRLVLKYQNHTLYKNRYVVDRRRIRKNNALMQTWQRIHFSARSVYLDLPGFNLVGEPTSLLAKQLSMFRNIENISGFAKFQIISCCYKIVITKSNFFMLTFLAIIIQLIPKKLLIR